MDGLVTSGVPVVLGFRWPVSDDGAQLLAQSFYSAWLDEENPDWEGNYKVKFWMPEWQAIVYEYLDRIIDADFNGIYCDIVDAYEYYEETVQNSDWLMIDFVCNISDYVKSEAGKDFAVFVQNADELLHNSTYLKHIDGIGREDLFYNDDIATEEDWREEGIENLKEALDADKTVLVTDYPTIESVIYDFYSNCINNGFLGYAGERDLDSLKEYWFYPAT